MATYLYLFTGSQMAPEKNYIFESPTTLNALLAPNGASGTLVDSDFMYVRIGLEISIKVSKTQNNIGSASFIDYAHIYQDGVLYRFFVMHLEQIATETIQFDLKMDVLNTFHLESYLSKRTHTYRKHKKSWLYIHRSPQGYDFFPVIDRFPEQINPSLEKKLDKPLIPVAEKSKNLLNLETATTIDSGAVVTSSQITFGVPSPANTSEDIQVIKVYGTLFVGIVGTFTPNQITSFALVKDSTWDKLVFRRVGNNTTLNVWYNMASLPAGSYTIGANLIYQDVNTLCILNKIMLNAGDSPLPYEPWHIDGFASFWTDRKWYIVYLTDNGDPKSILCSDTAFKFKVGGSSYTSGTIDDIPRDDASIIRIVHIPLPPFSMVPNDNYEQVDSTGYWSNVVTINSKTFLSPVIDQDFISYRGNEILLPTSEVPNYDKSYYPSTAGGISNDMARSDFPDPKLLNSEFSEIKVLINDNAMLVKLEDLKIADARITAMDLTISKAPDLRFNYYVSDTFDGNYILMASRDYDYPFVASSELGYGRDATKFEVIFQTDYDYLLVSKIMYEMPIYNSDYLQYVRYGYSYDKQKLDTELETMGVSSTSSVALAVLGAIGAGIFGGPLGLIGGAAAVAGTAVNAMLKQIKATNMGNLELEQKLSTMKMQAGNINGNSKASLLWRYNAITDSLSPRAGQYAGFRWQLYQPREDVKKMLDNLFYFYGYACDEIGTPDIHVKMNFDYLQCDAEFNLPSGGFVGQNNGLTIDYLNEIKSKYKDGVTFVHKLAESSGVPIFDLDPTHANMDNI